MTDGGSPETQRSYWDRLAAQYSDLGRAGFWLKHRRALVAGLPHGSRVLEVCCGGGQLVADMLASGHDAYGLDRSPAMVEQSRATLACAGFDPSRVRQGDVTAIEHPDGSFDAVVCTGAVGLFDLTTQRRALAEMARVSRERVLLLEPLEQRPGLYPGRVLGWLFDGQRPIPPAALRDSGLTVTSTRPVLGGSFSLSEAHVSASPGAAAGAAPGPMATTALVAGRHGGPEVLGIRSWTVPSPGRGQVRTRVEAAGISHADLLVCQGLHPERRMAPFVPGWDVVGVVERVGPGVPSFEVGQHVAGLTIVGGWAEHAVLPAAWAVPVPDRLSAIDAVCVVMDYVVAHQMLTRVAPVGAASTVLVQGVAGGVGTAVLQLAARRGVTVLGTDHGDRRPQVEALGGTLIDIDSEDVPTRVRDLTAGRGVDAAYDGVGVTARQSWQALSPNGRLVWFGMASFLARGRRDPAATLRTLGSALPVLGAGLRRSGRSATLYSIQSVARRHPDWYRHDLALLLGMAARGDVTPVVSRTVSLPDAPAALAALSRGEVAGKQVIDVAGSARS